MIYLSEIENRPVPGARHVILLSIVHPIVLHNSALVPHRAMSPVTAVIPIDF